MSTNIKIEATDNAITILTSLKILVLIKMNNDISDIKYKFMIFFYLSPG